MRLVCLKINVDCFLGCPLGRGKLMGYSAECRALQVLKYVSRLG